MSLFRIRLHVTLAWIVGAIMIAIVGGIAATVVILTKHLEHAAVPIQMGTLFASIGLIWQIVVFVFWLFIDTISYGKE